MASILQVIPSLHSGGVERGVVEIANFLSTTKHTPLVLSSGGDMALELKQKKIRHITLNVASKNPLIILRNIGKIKKMIQELSVDIIHARSRAPAWSCYYACLGSNTRFITTVHGIYNTNFLKKLYNNVMTKGDPVIAVSNWVKNYLVKNYNLSEEKIKVIPRGVDTNYFNITNTHDNKIAYLRAHYRVPLALPVLLLPARITHWKGHKILLNALHKLKHLDFYCLIVGDTNKHTEYASLLRNYILDLRMQTKVQVFCTQKDILHLYAISDIILSPSTRPEAFGRTIIEAQAMEKLVIASDIGGASETIKNLETGLHFTSGCASDLADKIKYALSILDTERYKNLVNCARKFVTNNYSLQKMHTKTLEVYNQIL